MGKGREGGREGGIDVPLLSVEVIAALDDLAPVPISFLTQPLVL